VVTFIGASKLVVDVGVTYLVLEYCPNQSVFDFLRDNQNKISYQQIVGMALDCARGMHHMHCQNLIHRDLKSLNLLLDSSFTIKICDFGETKNVEGKYKKEGTYDWMAPEVFCRESYSGKGDVFAFGIIVWELCTQQTPPNRSDMDVCRGLIKPFPKIFQEELGDVVKLANTCCQKHPGKRLSFLQIMQHLEVTKLRLDLEERFKEKSARVKIAHT